MKPFPCNEVASRLLPWYADNARSLPWRETRDPYHIWISEIMLQQTQVATVIPYYHRFLERFPDLRALGTADVHDVLRLWEGLGYYRRARQLHAAALKMVTEHDGMFPTTFADVIRLPGIGRYTAGAILCFAFGQRHPILEANTLRLYSRLIALREVPQTSQGQKVLWRFAEEILPHSNVAEMNQGLMELGSRVCTPREPACLLCPLKDLCRARKAGLQDEIPGRVKKVQYESVTEYALAVRDRRGRVWLRQRSAEERWAGLWDFPRYEPHEAVEPHLVAGQALGFPVTLGNRLHTLQHGVTRFRITLHLDQATIAGRAPRSKSNAAWHTPESLREIALTTPARRLIKAIH